jgi:hypothetical protein
MSLAVSCIKPVAEREDDLGKHPGRVGPDRDEVRTGEELLAVVENQRGFQDGAPRRDEDIASVYPEPLVVADAKLDLGDLVDRSDTPILDVAHAQYPERDGLLIVFLSRVTRGREPDEDLLDD